MKYVIAKSTGKPIKLITVKKSEFNDYATKSGDEYLKTLTTTTRMKKDSGNYYVIRDGRGAIKHIVVLIDDEPNIWTFACLPKKLPENTYELGGTLDARELTDAAIGWELGTYYFDRYRDNPTVYAKLVAPKKADMHEARITIESIFLARDLINTTPADLGPEELADAAIEVAKKCGASYKLIEDKDLLKAGYESIYTVGKGSEKRPRLVDITWGNQKHPKVTLVGKGVTFDTGGLNMKNETGMALMKKDMAGAAIVLGLGKMIMEADLPVRLRVMIPTVENSVSGRAYRPSDVIKTRAGITVEVTNTDAEGRLILCEPLAEADKEKPDLLIDVATLTGAARTAVGTELAAFFATSNEIAHQVEEAGRDVADYVWRLPLWEGYRYMIKTSKVADMVNSPESGNGGAITAALFLKEFILKTKHWLHFDLIAWNTRERAGRPVGGEPMAMRALFHMIKRRYS